MTEVKDFERHRRFKKFLAMEDAWAKRPERPTVSLHSEQKSRNNDLKSDLADESMIGSKRALLREQGASPKLLSLPPRRLPKLDEPDEFHAQPNSQNSQTVSSSSQSMASSSSALPPPAPIPAWALPPTTLPPPFSQGTRTVSDEHTLPSPPGSTRPTLSSTERLTEPPMTPPRQSSLRDIRADDAASLSSGGGRTGLFRSAVRFVGSYVHSPSHGSPAPRGIRSTSGSPWIEERVGRVPDGQLSSDSRFRIYNDSLPAASQPQTPRNLPEARHQSRIEGSYTAPVSRMAARSASQYHSGTVQRRGGRAESPSGLDTPGFRGLYGGIENSDDAMLRDATRFHEGPDEEDEGGNYGR